MRIVSDFLDRLAGRAIGGEAVLSPRMPSLFESMRPSSPDPQDQLPVSSPQEVRSNTATRYPGEAMPTPVSLRHVESAIRPARAISHAESALESLPSEQEAPLRDVLKPKAATQPADIAMADHDDSSSMSGHKTVVVRERRDREPVSASTPSVPRKPQVFASSSDESIHDIETGVLLPPARPVFATPPATQMPRGPASGPPQAMDNHASSPEPVVHVSIGRLEVRAAPTQSTTPPKRQETPRPNSLDEYLRQRSGKSS